MIGAWTDFRSRTIPVGISLTALTVALWMAVETQAYFLASASLLIFIVSNLSQWYWLPALIAISLLSSELFIYKLPIYFPFYALVCLIWFAWLHDLVGGADVLIVQALLTAVPHTELLLWIAVALLIGSLLTWLSKQKTVPVVTCLSAAQLCFQLSA